MLSDVWNERKETETLSCSVSALLAPSVVMRLRTTPPPLSSSARYVALTAR